MAVMERIYKPVELYGKYKAIPIPTLSSSSVTEVLTDIFGRVQMVGAVATDSSAVYVNPILIAGVNAAGNVTPLITTGGTLQVNTELELTGTLIANLNVFKDSAGTIQAGLVDASRRIILAPTSTVVLDGSSTISLSATGTVPVSFATTSTLGASITALPGTSSTVNLYSNTSTVNIGTTGTIGVMGISGSITAPFTGAVNTSTFPVSFPSTSTLGAAVSGNVGLANTTGTVGASITALPGTSSTVNLYSNTSTVNIGTTGTIGLSGHTTSTIPISTDSAVATNTSTAFWYAATASTLLASNTSRKYAILRNVSAATLKLQHGAAPTADNYDLILNNNDSYEINQINKWQGQIQGIGSAGGTVTILEW